MKNLIKAKSILFFAMLLSLCLCSCDFRYNLRSKTSHETEIRETVFKHAFEIAGRNVPKTSYVFLSYLADEQDKDLPDKLVSKLKIEYPNLKNISESKQGRDGIPTDKETGIEGFKISLTDINWLSKTEAEIGTRFWSGGWSLRWYTHRLKFEKGRWVITDTLLTGIS